MFGLSSVPFTFFFPRQAVKEPVLTAEAEKRIGSIEFATLESEEYVSMSMLQLKNGEMYTSRRAPAPNGPLDPRLGAHLLSCN